MAVRRMRRTRTRRLVQLAKPRVTAINSQKGWEDLLRKADGRTLVIMFGGVSEQTSFFHERERERDRSRPFWVVFECTYEGSLVLFLFLFLFFCVLAMNAEAYVC